MKSEGLKLRSDLFALVALFFIYGQGYWQAGACIFLCVVRYFQALQIDCAQEESLSDCRPAGLDPEHNRSSHP